ncbi:MAG: hypothetical protein V8R51_01235 [Clostridia bacterium]
MKLQSEQLRSLSNENKIEEYKEIKRKYDIARDTIRILATQMKQKDSIIQDLTARLNKNSRTKVNLLQRMALKRLSIILEKKLKEKLEDS